MAMKYRVSLSFYTEELSLWNSPKAGFFTKQRDGTGEMKKPPNASEGPPPL